MKQKIRDQLTDKQAMFCEEYLVDLNATQAAIRAGYSENSAQIIGFENLSKPIIQEYIQEHMDKRSTKLGITAEYVLNNIIEINDRCMQRSKVMIRDGKTMKQKTEFNDEGEEVGVWEFREVGALKANELLGRHLKLFTDKLEHLGEGLSDKITIIYGQSDKSQDTLDSKTRASASVINE